MIDLEKCTKGPWHRNVSAKYPVYAGEPTNWKYIAHVIDQKDPDETMANLQLVTLAPDMAALLDRLEQVYDGDIGIDAILRATAKAVSGWIKLKGRPEGLQTRKEV